MKLKVGSVKVGSVKAANALLNHLKFLFLGFLWRLHAVIEKLSLAWCEMLTLLKNTQSVFNYLCLRINQKTLFDEKIKKN
ncbi:hypothetical protein ID0741_00400 [Helicobacter pylori]